MNKKALDHATAERLLSGGIAPDDAPPGFASVAAVLRAAARPAASTAVDQQRIAAMAGAISGEAASEPTDKGKAPKAVGRLRRASLAAGIAAGVVFGSTGLAMAGALGPMQSVAASILAKVGISVPDGHSTAGPNGGSGATVAPSPTPTKGPDANGPAKFGLCNAFFSGQGGTNGNKNNSVAFQNLQQAAKDAGQSVEAFCASATPGGKGSSNGHHGHDQGKNNGPHNGQHGLPPQSNGRGHGKGNG